eukprot:SAG31_NODE_8386_length_1461_cov_21.727564_1_plen_177_part_00
MASASGGPAPSGDGFGPGKLAPPGEGAGERPRGEGPPGALHRLLVYGTLMTGLRNHRTLEATGEGETARLVGRGQTLDKYTMFAQTEAGQEVPFVDPDVPTSAVRGEVWAVCAATLARLDELEGHPDWYVRAPCAVELESGERMEVGIYFNRNFRLFGMHETAAVVEDGDFRSVCG